MAGILFKVKVCRGPTCGTEKSSEVLHERLKVLLAEANLSAAVELSWQSCFGRCSQGRNMLVRAVQPEPEATYSLAIMPKKKGKAALYSRLGEDDLVDIVREHLIGGRVVRRLLSVKPKSLRKPTNEAAPDHPLPQVLSTVRGIPEGER